VELSRRNNGIEYINFLSPLQLNKMYKLIKLEITDSISSNVQFPVFRCNMLSQFIYERKLFLHKYSVFLNIINYLMKDCDTSQPGYLK